MHSTDVSSRGLPDLGSVKRILIVRLSAIGDVVHALPLASALKDAYPHLEITWLVEEIPADMVLGNPDLHDVIVLPRSRWKRGRTRSPRVWAEYLAFLGELRRRRFDVTIDLQGYAKSALLALATGARYRLGWWRLRDGANLVSRALPRLPTSIHRVDWFLDVARALGIPNPGVRFPLHIPIQARESIAARLASAGIAGGRTFVVMNQAAGNPPRRWARQRFGELALEMALRFGLPTVLIGTTPEAADCEAVVEQVRTGLEARIGGDGLAPLNLAGATTLKETAALLDSCALHVSGDTGSTHIAAALGTPVVAFYGSSDPAHAGPWGQFDHVLARRDLCSPACTVRQCAYSVMDGGSAGALTSAALASTDAGDPLLSSARCLNAIIVEEALVKVEEVLTATYSQSHPSFDHGVGSL